MFWFFPKKKPGFAKGTVTITLRYSGSNLTKIYCTDYELFAAAKQGKKAKRKMGAKFAICKRGYKSPLRCRPWCQSASIGGTISGRTFGLPDFRTFIISDL